MAQDVPEAQLRESGVLCTDDKAALMGEGIDVDERGIGHGRGHEAAQNGAASTDERTGGEHMIDHDLGWRMVCHEQDALVCDEGVEEQCHGVRVYAIGVQMRMLRARQQFGVAEGGEQVRQRVLADLFGEHVQWDVDGHACRAELQARSMRMRLWTRVLRRRYGVARAGAARESQ